MKGERNKMKVFGIVCVVAVIFLGSCGFPFLTSDTTTFTVTDKERITTNNNNNNISSKYLVFTNSETFENTDCFVYFKFDSSDLQSKIRRGRTYKAHVYGWRIPFLSSYRNIVSVEPF